MVVGDYFSVRTAPARRVSRWAEGPTDRIGGFFVKERFKSSDAQRGFGSVS